MNSFYDAPFEAGHDHVFLGAGHDKNARKTWAVIALCGAMMIAEIVGGSLFGSLALIADGLHMSTHAGAMLIAALAYTYARKHANDPRFVFGTGKLGDLAGFSSALILAMIALLIGYEAIVRLLSPIPIHFNEAIPIATVGLLVNVVSAWLLSGDDHHGHHHRHGNDDHDELGGHEHSEEIREIVTPAGVRGLSIFEESVPPVFRIHAKSGHRTLSEEGVTVTTVRPNGARQVFIFSRKGDFLESTTSIPEPHAFEAIVTFPGSGKYPVRFEEHAHGHHDHEVDARDHNFRAAYVHILADAAVSVLTIIGLLLAKTFGWLWMDPLAGIVGALVISNWAFGLLRDTGGILLDISPSDQLPSRVRTAVEMAGDQLVDLHVWRLGPGHFGAIVSVMTQESLRVPVFYHSLLKQIKGLSHITVEIHSQPRTK